VSGGPFTLGIEEEFQLVHPETHELHSHVAQLFQTGEELLPDKVKRELHKSVVEIGTSVCADIREARRDVTETRAALIRIAKENDLRIAAAGTHPTTHWSDVETTEDARYDKLLTDLQVVARANLIFGLHIHVGIDDRDDLIHVFNMARYFVPHLMTLTVNSPFWCARETGWQSYRTKIFEKFPRTGIPPAFASWGEFAELIDDLVQSNSIDSGKSLWWDIRPHWRFPTIEFRCFDVPTRADETIALAALCQALVAKLHWLHKRNLSFRLHKLPLIMENKWRAARWGIHGKLIDLGKKREVATPILIGEILDFVDDVVDDLGSRHEIEYIREILATGTGADRQLKVWQETGDLRAVVNNIIKETEHGLPTA
jgi:carboxylate-amine ligase